MTDSTKQGGLLPTRYRPGIDSNFSQRGCIGIRDVEIKSIRVACFLSSDRGMAPSREEWRWIQRNENTVKRFRSWNFPPRGKESRNCQYILRILIRISEKCFVRNGGVTRLLGIYIPSNPSCSFRCVASSDFEREILRILYFLLNLSCEREYNYCFLRIIIPRLSISGKLSVARRFSPIFF